MIFYLGFCSHFSISNYLNTYPGLILLLCSQLEISQLWLVKTSLTLFLFIFFFFSNAENLMISFLMLLFYLYFRYMFFYRNLLVVSVRFFVWQIHWLFAECEGFLLHSYKYHIHKFHFYTNNTIIRFSSYFSHRCLLYEDRNFFFSHASLEQMFPQDQWLCTQH